MERTGKNLSVFLANMGPVAQHKARADFITGFMEVGGFEVLKNDGFESPEECADAFAVSGADVAVICSTDEVYPELAPRTARALKGKNPNLRVFLAGSPAEEHRTAYLESGIENFINVRSDCLEVLSDLARGGGVLGEG
jgi:methylmalonyl-CoA mutase